jgi:hypothetical protein
LEYDVNVENQKKIKLQILMKIRHKSNWRKNYRNKERKSRERAKEEQTLINLFVDRLRTSSVT